MIAGEDEEEEEMMGEKECSGVSWEVEMWCKQICKSQHPSTQARENNKKVIKLKCKNGEVIYKQFYTTGSPESLTSTDIVIQAVHYLNKSTQD